VAGRVFAPPEEAPPALLLLLLLLLLTELLEPLSSQQETLSLKVPSSAFTDPKSFITRNSGPMALNPVGGPCTIRTGNDTGAVPGGVGPGENLGTVMLPV